MSWIRSGVDYPKTVKHLKIESLNINFCVFLVFNENSWQKIQFLDSSRGHPGQGDTWSHLSAHPHNSGWKTISSDPSLFSISEHADPRLISLWYQLMEIGDPPLISLWYQRSSFNFSFRYQSMQTQQTLPPVSYTKAIDVWLATCVVFVFLRFSVGPEKDNRYK